MTAVDSLPTEKKGAFKRNDAKQLYNQYGDESGPFTSTLLYDKETKNIVCNESTEILRMLNFEFNDIATNPEVHLYPVGVEGELEELNVSQGE